MRIQIICPAPPNSLYGIRVTATRWAKILTELGHSVEVSQHYGGTICELLVGLQAHRSAEAVLQFHNKYPTRPIAVVLTGADIYRDIRASPQAQKVLEVADRLIAFQPLALEELPKPLRGKARIIYQSAVPTALPTQAGKQEFVVTVVGHLRSVKDPLRAAFADALDEELARKARDEMLRNPRYRWVGSIPRWKVRRLIASSRLLVLSSQIEGGANVISEAAVDYVPVLASEIPGSVGLLGEDYPGYFPPGNTKALTALLRRAESDPDFYQGLKTRCVILARLFRPERERTAWKQLLKEIEKRGR
jgi:putative glycosyltransferase (TIGR04348 family)